MKPLRIVLLMLEAPVPFGNAAARWYYVLLRELVARGHRVTCIAACSKQSEIEEARRLFPEPDYDLRLYPFPTRRGLLEKLQTLQRSYSYMFSPELRRDLDAELARGFDVLHLEQLWCGWLALAHRERALVNVHHLTWIDLQHVRPLELGDRLARHLMLHTERRLVRKFVNFRACSPRLVPEILVENPRAHVMTIPVGVDPTLYDFIVDEQRSAAAIVGVIGNMNWYPTQSAAIRLLTRLWPEIKRRIPAAKVQLVGWGAREVLARFLDEPDVIVAENVPDTRPYFERTSVMLYAPGRGSGMKIKVLEALGYGVPVVTTSEGVEGLPAVDGIHAGVCEDDAGLIERTVALLRDPIAQNAQRAAARALLESHCGPGPTVNAIERAYATMLGVGDIQLECPMPVKSGGSPSWR